MRGFAYAEHTLLMTEKAEHFLRLILIIFREPAVLVLEDSLMLEVVGTFIISLGNSIRI